MCGIVGIVGQSDVSGSLYDALTILQHRGQDAAGIATCQDNKLFLHKDLGLVFDVFNQDNMLNLKGRVGIGHVRYPTAGTFTAAEAQPFYVNSPYGIVLAHNGNLINTEQLTDEVYKTDLRHVNTTSDSEVLLNVFAHELTLKNKLKPEAEDIFDAIKNTHKRIVGAYAVIGMLVGLGVIGFRDPNGIRPVVFGKKETPYGTEFIISSESVVLDVLGFEWIRDLDPGEAIYITNDGQVFSKQCSEKTKLSPCIFEYVYLSRPDSMIDGISVYKSRIRMGEKLAEKILRHLPVNDIDVVMPIPDTSRPVALQLASYLNITFREGFIKNSYIGRTFIMPDQEMRKKSVKRKLNTIDLEFKDKVVLLVDDSIVRGTTCKQIIQMARDAGAKKVYFASAAPAIRFPNIYGIDMPSSKELVAYNKTEDDVRKIIGADELIYQDLDDLIDAVTKSGKYNIDSFDCSVFDGKYVTGDVPKYYFERLGQLRENKKRC